MEREAEASKARGRGAPAVPLREVVTAPDPEALFLLEYCDVRFWYPWHFHPEIEIKHIVTGAGTRRIGDSIESFADGDLCLVGSGTPHSWTSSPVRGRWVRAQVVQFSPELFEESGVLGRAFPGLGPFLRAVSGGLEFVGKERAEIARELGRLLAARTEARRRSHLTALLLIAQEAENGRLLNGPGPVRRGPEHELAERVLRFIHDSAGGPLTEERAASAFGSSPSAFSRFFVRSFGKPFSRYVAELRVARASNLLLSRDLEVKAIAELVGFGTVASLNRHFRAVKMTTPTAYRRRGRELNVGLRAAHGEVLRCDGDGHRKSI